MKTTFGLLCILLSLSITISGYAQKAKKVKSFGGIITYDITYEGEGIDATTLAQLPSQLVVSINGNKIRNEQISPLYSMSSISNFDDGSTIVLIDMMGMKIAVNQSKEEMEKNLAEAGIKDPEIKILDETKVIAGYNCKKAEVTTGEDVVEVYFTDELIVPAGINDQNGFKGINGLLMQYTVNQQGMIMTMTVKEIKKAKVKSGMFVIPDDYEIKTAEELGGMLGG
ncbi:MAG TPA: DUF4412 domain-containing protein [Bacteroidales bacterium]|nr:DUF4412 domain-containing protein [Bacteroidales bacterium]